MTVAILQSAESRMVVDLSPLAQLSEADFVALCAANPELPGFVLELANVWRPDF